MGHLQSTMRRIEDEEASAAVPVADLSESEAIHPLDMILSPKEETFDVPAVGTSVQFRLRGNEWRNGQDTFAALVTKANPADGTVSVVVVLGADDFMEQQNVPKFVGEGDWGWSMLEGFDGSAVAQLRAELKAFKAELADVIFGKFPKGEESIYDVLQEHDNRLALLAGGNSAETGSSRRRHRQKG
jgi:hypothetical protein